jgi:hypothetical protein
VAERVYDFVRADDQGRRSVRLLIWRIRIEFGCTSLRCQGWHCNEEQEQNRRRKPNARAVRIGRTSRFRQ